MNSLASSLASSLVVMSLLAAPVSACDFAAACMGSSVTPQAVYAPAAVMQYAAPVIQRVEVPVIQQQVVQYAMPVIQRQVIQQVQSYTVAPVASYAVQPISAVVPRQVRTRERIGLFGRIRRRETVTAF